MPTSASSPLRGSAPPLLPGAQAAGTADPDERLEISLLLRYRPRGGEPRARSAGRRGGRPLSDGDFAGRYGADPGDLRAVEGFAGEHGLEVEAVEPVQRLVHLSGSAGALAEAFGVELLRFEHPDGAYRGHSGPLHLQPRLVGRVTGVFGLDDRPVAWPRIRHHPIRHAKGTVPKFPPGTFLPTELAALYGFPAGTTGAGQSIALIELGGGYEPGAVEHYFAEAVRLPMPKIRDVSVLGGRNAPGSNPLFDAEVALDIEVVGAVAPGAEIVVYFSASSNRGFLAAVKRAVHDAERRHGVISVSWAGPEHQQTEMGLRAMNEALWEAAVKGITVCCAVGDSGSADSPSDPDGLAHVGFPASSPFALACGGTTIEAADGTIRREVVWNDAAAGGGATGGGVSRYFASPAYQRAAGVRPRSVNPGHAGGRGVPDVAADADPRTGYVVQVGEKFTRSGGTSAATPMWAALIARIRERLGERVGALTPLLYQLGSGSGAFRDITAGDNTTAPAGGYEAGPGWDACSGWGSPDGEALLEALSHLSPAQRAAAVPPASPGGPRSPAAEAPPAAGYPTYPTWPVYPLWPVWPPRPVYYLWPVSTPWPLWPPRPVYPFRPPWPVSSPWPVYPAWPSVSFPRQ